VRNALVVANWSHDLGAYLEALFQDLLDTIPLIVQADSVMNEGDISAARLLGNALSDLEHALVIMSDALIVANWFDDFRAVPEALLQHIFGSVLSAVQAHAVMDNGDVSAAGLLGNALPDLKLALVVVRDALIVANWSHDLGANLQTLLKDVFDTEPLVVETDAVVDDGDVSAAGLLGDALPDLEFALVVVGDAFVVADREKRLVAGLDAFIQNIANSILTWLGVDRATA